MAIVLGPNQYGKAEVRVVAVDRSTPRHSLVDLNVSSALRGDFAAAHTSGDNAHVLTTDAQKNTVFAFARDGVGSPEEFGLRLARHFAGSYDWVSGARVAVESYGWDRITVGGTPHDHAFSRNGGEVRTAVVTVDGDDVHVLAGLTDLVVLKSTGSEFWGFPRDRYTTLPETTDRILATAVTARWRYTGTDVDWDAAYAAVRTTLLETFAGTHSLALQQTLYAMGEAVLEADPAVAEVRFSMPNKHHFLQDLSTFGLDNALDGPGAVVYHADDRPYGLIEGTVLRDDVPAAPAAWLGTPGFC
ncbi:factor-independent urate hydroxylase [Modestobacter versicolor]|uniref:factor-independent urate hydroxylase n=1 Tax=Modestobacter versicolor TaxID=429133 RepID=UPI0034DEB475